MTFPAGDPSCWVAKPFCNFNTNISNILQKANNARIRDNQRRSRARKKEYLQEIEEKWRKCKQLGVEASMEMQVSARHVLAENARLRALLKNRGMSDAEIDSYMGADDDIFEDGAPPSEKLTNMLLTRKPCCPDNEDASSCSPPSATTAQDTKPQMQLPPPHVHQQQLSSRQLAPIPIMVQSTISPRMALPLATTIPISSAPMQLLSSYHSAPSPLHSGPQSHSTPTYTAYSCHSHWQPPAPPVSSTYDSAGRVRPMQTYTSDIRSSGDQAANTIRSIRIDQGQDFQTDLGYVPVTGDQVDNVNAMNDMQKYGNHQSHGMWR